MIYYKSILLSLLTCHLAGATESAQSLTFGSPSGGLRVVLVRHGQSLGNVDAAKYTEYGDHAVPLSDAGIRQAQTAGGKINELYTRLYGSTEQAKADGRRVRMWVSPFTRTRETAREVLDGGAKEWVTDLKENVSLVEQDWGLAEGPGREELGETNSSLNQASRRRSQGGTFWSRMPNGENVADVVMRQNDFLRTLRQDHKNGVTDIIVVSHGVTIRALIMRMMRYSPNWLASARNPENCSVYFLDGQTDAGFVFGGYDREGQLVDTEGLNETLTQKRQTDCALLSSYYGDLHKISCGGSSELASKKSEDSDESSSAHGYSTFIGTILAVAVMLM